MKLLEEKKRQFQTNNPDTFRLVEFAEFQGYLETLRERYSRRSASRFIMRYAETLENLQSFERAITSITQTNDASSCLWGGLQIVIEVSVHITLGYPSPGERGNPFRTAVSEPAFLTGSHRAITLLQACNTATRGLPSR